jgi:translation initiation factor 1
MDDRAKVHVRIYQRKGKKYVTTIEGLKGSESSTLSRALAKSFHCTGAIKKDPNNLTRDIVQLTGDQRYNVRSYLTSKASYKNAQIVIHGG